MNFQHKHYKWKAKQISPQIEDRTHSVLDNEWDTQDHPVPLLDQPIINELIYYLSNFQLSTKSQYKNQQIRNDSSS